MELHEELSVVRRETELDCDLETAWERVSDLDWLGEDAEVLDAEAPRHLELRWTDDDRTVVDITLEPVGDERTRVVVVETPVRVLQLVGDQVAAGLPSGPLMHA